MPLAADPADPGCDATIIQAVPVAVVAVITVCSLCLRRPSALDDEAERIKGQAGIPQIEP